MATPKQPRVNSKITSGSSQSTNPQIDSQEFFSLLQASQEQTIQSHIENLRPQIEQKISDMVSEEKDRITAEITKSKEELKDVKNSVLGAVAVFAAFFTFISVNINIFDNTSSKEAAILMLIMWVCLMGFTYTFFLFLWDKWRSFLYWLPVVTGMAFSTCLIVFLDFGSATLAR